MNNDEQKQKEQLLQEIETLIDQNNPIQINKNYLKYFDIEQLQEIYEKLQDKKESNKTIDINSFVHLCS